MLVAFSGLKGSGKDTAAQFLVDHYDFTRIAFADAVREMALAIDPIIGFNAENLNEVCRLSEAVELTGWDYCKRNSQEVRRLLQVIGTEAVRNIVGEDTWPSILQKRFPSMADDDTKYVISDCRFPNEVEFVRNKGGMLVWIDRPGLVSDGHASESTEIKDLAAYIIHNDSTIEQFHKDLELLMFMRGLDIDERRAEK